MSTFIRQKRLGNTSLDEGLVRRIRRLAADGVPVAELAAAFSVGRETIRRIVRRETWQHISDEALPAALPVSPERDAELSRKAAESLARVQKMLKDAEESSE